MSGVVKRLHDHTGPGKIRVLSKTRALERSSLTGQVFVTIGAGECHISVLDNDGRCHASWLAIFGWSCLFSIPVDSSGIQVNLDEPDAVARALSGSMRIYGRSTDTSAWIDHAESYMLQALEDILEQTIGAGLSLDGIILAGPKWLHILLARMRRLRPNIFDEIRDS